MIHEVEAIFGLFVWSWFGYEVSTFFLQKYVNKLTRVGIGIPFGFITYSWIVFLLNVKYELTPTLGWFSTSFLFFISSILSLFHNSKEKKSLKDPRFIDILITILIPTVFLSLLFKNTILDKDMISRGASYGDLPFHLNIINSFVKGCNMKRKSVFDMKSVFFANVKLAYPVMTNYLSSILISCFKLSLRNSIYFPSFPIIFSLIALLNSIVNNFTKDRLACYLAPWIFMFMGGRGFFNFFDSKKLQCINADFTHIVGTEDEFFYWLHNLYNVIFPQRLSLFGIPVSYAYLIVMYNVDFKSVKPFIFAGLIIALMPQLQAHACIAAFEWTLAFGILHFPLFEPKKWLRQIICYASLGIPALGLALPQLLIFMTRAKGKGFFSAIPIWKDMNQNFFTLWWDALFIFWIIAIFLGPFMLNKKQLIKYIPSLVVYIISNLVLYQPWNIDNSKVFHAGWVPLAIAVVANYFSIILKSENILVQFISVILLIVMNFSGIIAVQRNHQMTAPQWDTGYYPSDYIIKDLVEDVVHLSNYDDVFITDSFHNHPIPALAGRQVLVGYRGWLASHNLPENDRIRGIEETLDNPKNPKYADSQNVSFLVYTKEKHDEIKIDIGNSPYWSLCSENKLYKIYRRLK